MSKLVALLATSAVVASVATAAVADSNNLTGFYIGATGGYGAGTSEHKVGKPSSSKSDFGMKGAVGGLYLGFQKDFGKMVAGLEGSASLSNTEGTSKSKSRFGSYKSTFKRKDAYGIALRLGAKINNWFVYGKAGYENAKFSLRSRGFGTSASKTKRLGGFVPGIGFETMVSNHVMVGAEWTYSLYKGKNFAGKKNTTRNHESPRIGDFKVRLGYKF